MNQHFQLMTMRGWRCPAAAAFITGGIISLLPAGMALAESPAVAEPAQSQQAELHWLHRLVPILTGYGLLFLLGHALIRWVRNRAKEHGQSLRPNCCFELLRLFALGQPEHCLANGSSTALPAKRDALLDGEGGTGMEEEEGKVPPKRRRTAQGRGRRRHLLGDCFHLCLYFLGIQACLLCMGFFQERIVTRGYTPRGTAGAEPPAGGQKPREEFFRDAQFLVFANRLVAFLLSGVYILLPVQKPWAVGGTGFLPC